MKRSFTENAGSPFPISNRWNRIPGSFSVSGSIHSEEKKRRIAECARLCGTGKADFRNPSGGCLCTKNRTMFIRCIKQASLLHRGLSQRIRDYLIRYNGRRNPLSLLSPYESHPRTAGGWLFLFQCSSSCAIQYTGRQMIQA